MVGLARLLSHSDLNTTGIYTQPTTDDLAVRLERLPLNAYDPRRTPGSGRDSFSLIGVHGLRRARRRDGG
jgi:hypothetical protein